MGIAFILATGSSCGDSTTKTADAPLVRINEADATACPEGGSVIAIGLDTNRNGVLEDAEVSSVQTICTDQAPASLVTLAEEAPGDICPAGGTRIDAGLDDGSNGGVAGNGVLEQAEIRTTKHVCNGVSGAMAGALVVRTSTLAAGAACAEGGQLIELGADDGEGGGVAGDGVLQDGEVDRSLSVCNGARGYAALVSLESVAAGVDCPYGGTRILVGTDDGSDGATAGDGILGTGELDAVEYACHGAPAFLALMITETLAPGVTCPAGGFVLHTGLDNGQGGETAGDGILGEGEIASSATICNGLAGTNGDPGATALVRQSALAAGGVCANGGTQIETGVDDGADGGVAGDGELQPGEVNATQVICNGTDGDNGHNALVSQAAVAPGATCATGGVQIVTGTDDGTDGGIADDGILQAGEVASTETLCNGAAGESGSDGHSALVVQTALAVGSACANGGVRVDTGLDDGTPTGTADDGVLQEGEIQASHDICNGIDATNGTNGFSSLITTTPISPGAVCANGGVRIDTGLDDGLPTGTASNLTLDPGEVETSEHVCNGQDGVGGSDSLRLKANGVDLGRVVGVTNRQVTFVTSTGYVVSLFWNGLVPNAQFYWSNADCTGTAYLNTGSSTYVYYLGEKWASYSAPASSFMIPDPATITNGYAASAPGAIAAVESTSTGACSASTSTNNVWRHVPAARATVGVPAAIGLPLTLE